MPSPPCEPDPFEFPLGVFPLGVGAHGVDDEVPGSDGVVEGSLVAVEGSAVVVEGSVVGADGSADGVGLATGNDGAGSVDGRPEPVGNVTIVPSVTAMSWSCDEP